MQTRRGSAILVPHTPDASRTMTSTDRGYRLTVLGLAALALALVAYPVVRMAWDFEIDQNEGWNAYYQVRAAAGQSLYVLDSPLAFNNYPPLSFYLVGTLARLVGDPVLAGRLASCLALAGIAASCSAIVRAGGGSHLDAGLAAATCVGLFAALATDYVGMNDPQLLAQSLILAGFALYLGDVPTPRRGAATALLFAAGILCKHNLTVVPLLVAADLLRRGPPAARAAFFATGLGLAAAAAAVLALLVGRTFFVQLLASRTYDPEHGFLLTVGQLGRLQAPLAVVGLALAAARPRRPFGLVAGYLGLALVQGMVFAGGNNTDVNVFFDVYVALAIGTGLAARAAGEKIRLPGTRRVVALAANAGVIFAAPLALGRFYVDAAGEMTRRERLFHADVAYLRAIPGPAVCQSFLLCFRAGKPLFYDPFGVNQGIHWGRLPPDVLVARLRRREIPVLVISDAPTRSPDDLPGVQAMPSPFLHFGDDVFAALRRNYVVGRIGISGKFWLPKSQLPGAER